MQPAEREILQLLGTVNSIFTFLTAIAVIGLGLMIVRPLNKTAGIVYAIGGAARLFGSILDFILHALRPDGGDMNSVLLFSSISTLIWLGSSLVFYGGIIFATVKLAETQRQQAPQPARGVW